MRLSKSITLLAIMILIGVSCKSSKKTTKDTMNEEKTASISEMVSKGFKMGTIVTSKVDGDCPFTIAYKDDRKETRYYDPVNLKDSFKKDGEKIWFTFTGLRMMNRCEKANPISIVEIKKREE